MNKYRKLFGSMFALLIIVSFILIGYYIYESYLNKKEANNDDVKIDNFYNIDYLFNNNYLNLSKGIDDFSEKSKKIYMYLDADNVLYIKYTSEEILNKKVIDLPKDKLTVYYSDLGNNYYEFVAKTDNGDIYYVSLNLESSKDYSFVKVGSNIKNVYVPSYDKGPVFVNKTDLITTNFIFLDNDGVLKYLDFSNNKYVLKNDLSSVKPFFDYVCASDTSDICNDIMIYKTFDNELVYDGNTITDVDGKRIFISDMFSYFEIFNSSKLDFNSINSSNLKKYKYLFTTYAISNEGIIYKLEIDSTNKSEVRINQYSTNKVKQLNYVSKDKVQIVYDNGTIDLVESSDSSYLITSTLYDRNHLGI